VNMVCKFMDSPVGRLKLVASEKGLVAILWENDAPHRVVLGDLREDDRQAVLVETERQLREYFAGKRQDFSIPLDMRGTPFQMSVWEALLAIPFGETRSYGQLARQLGKPTAMRAVGAANGRNPISIVVPFCRRAGDKGTVAQDRVGMRVCSSPQVRSVWATKFLRLGSRRRQLEPPADSVDVRMENSGIGRFFVLTFPVQQ
jgi:methylated-DNA-[protein]-cysteine S-methyltransferase